MKRKMRRMQEGEKEKNERLNKHERRIERKYVSVK